MLYNSKQQVVTLTPTMIKVCAEGFADLIDGKTNTKSIKARQAILSPLRETKQHPNPCGRGTNGMFSLGERAKLISYTYDWQGGWQRVVQTNLFAC
jgi:hypothetical protein